MSCSLFELWVVSDDPAERRQAAEHASSCGQCREILDGHDDLLSRLEPLRSDLDSYGVLAPERLEEAIFDLPEIIPEIRVRTLQSAHRSPAVAVAAGFLLMLLGLWFFWPQSIAPVEAEHLLVTDALAAAQRAEREHARAIARLEAATDRALARAADPTTPPELAAQLFAYRDRLAFLDSTIAEVEGYLRDNPAQSEARTVLLAAFKEKTVILRDLISLHEETT